MKFLNKTKGEVLFLNEVKKHLDNTDWGYEYNGSTNDEDAKKACDYLSTQKFSLESIKEAIKEYYSDLLWNLRNEQITGEDKALYTARFIANNLAQQRISKFLYKPIYRVNGWSLSLIENTFFKIQ